MEELLAKAIRVWLGTLIWPIILALVLGAAALPGRDPEIVFQLAGIGLVVGIVDHVLGWISWGSPGYGRSVTWFLVSVYAPPTQAVADAGRCLHDAVLGMPPADRERFLGGLTAVYPRVAVAAKSSWTLVPASMRHEVR